jgi:methyl coenzyme M reductase subunit D
LVRNIRDVLNTRKTLEEIDECSTVVRILTDNQDVPDDVSAQVASVHSGVVG